MIAKRTPKIELSYMNIICALLVIFIHCASVLIGGTTKADAAFNIVFVPWRFSTFVVPAFIFMSGVKFFLTDRRMNYFKFYKGRVIRVVLPYMLWVVIYMMFFVNHHYFDFSWDKLIRYWIHGDLVGHFYFVIIIVQFYLLMPIWMYVLRRTDTAAGIICSILISVVFGFNLSNMLGAVFPNYVFEWDDVIFTKYLFYWVLGCYVGMNYAAFKKAVMSKKLLITILFLLSAALDIFLAYKTYNVVAPWMEEIHIVYCTAAILFFFMLTSLLAGNRKRVTWLTRALDEQCYNIYLSHCLVVLWLNDYLITEMGVTNVTERFGKITAAAYLVPIIFWLLWHLIKLLIKQIIKLIKKLYARIKNKKGSDNYEI